MKLEGPSRWGVLSANAAYGPNGNYLNSRGNSKVAPAGLIRAVDFCIFEVAKVDFERQARHFLTLLVKSSTNTRENY